MRHLRRWTAVLVTLATAGVVAVACGGGGVKALGEACVSSTECDLGLVCDFGQDPAVCATNSTIQPDAPEEETDAPVDPPDAPEVPIDAPPDAPPDAPDAA
jgi:hypothetical protein